jgi:catechol 2,3-dioxygenase-like lactoylglutathione lyase family enzyme
MKFRAPILFVHDLDRSKRFYVDVMGFSVDWAEGNVVVFNEGLEIHEGTSLQKTVWGETDGLDEAYGRRNLILYFEHEDIEAAFAAVAPHVRLIHPVEKQAWGQRVFRCYDPDGHAIEVGSAARD